MNLLNLACGGVRPQEPHWTNLDQLRSVLKPGTPERINLDLEKNYLDADITLPLPFSDNTFDAALASHCVEHLTAHAAAKFLGECRRILKPGGLLVVSVPDAEYFLKVYDRDTPKNAVELFGEPISKDEPWQPNFFSYALFQEGHQMILTESSLRCLLLKSGFKDIYKMGSIEKWCYGWPPCFDEIEKIMNRRMFSVELVAIKS